MCFHRVENLIQEETCKLPRLSDLNTFPDPDETFQNPFSNISVYLMFLSCCNTCIFCWITTCFSSSFCQLTLTPPLTLTLSLTLTSLLHFPSKMIIPGLVLAHDCVCCAIIDCPRTISRDIWPWINTRRNNFIRRVISAIWRCSSFEI